MIKITVDEAYAFDFYSILEIKKSFGMSVEEQLVEYRKEISSQLSDELFYEIYESKEYADLLFCNRLTFEAVDKAKSDEVKASYVDECNYRRTVAKKKLQQKFFNEGISEIKYGYEKLKINE